MVGAPSAREHFCALGPPAGASCGCSPQPLDGAVITIEYSTSRAEIWRWYWHAWARPLGLWRYHILIAGSVFVLIYLLGPHSQSALRLATTGGFVALVLVLVLFPLWPQLKFKPEIRTLSVDQQGVSTKVGTWHAVIPWREVGRIVPGADETYIEGKNGNAFIVPNRAFIAPQQRVEFLECAGQWRLQAAV